MNELIVNSIRKSFQMNQVLTDIYLECKTGEIIGLLGRNGSGKSTLLKIIFGSLPCKDKYVRINSDIFHANTSITKHVAYLPQFNFIPTAYRVKKALRLFMSKEKAALVLNNQVLEHIRNQEIKDLSGGELRILENLMIIYSDAKFVLLDEPFNGLAPIHKEMVKNMIKAEAKNKGFIITDHDYRNIIHISTKTVVLYDGGTKHIKSNDELYKWGYINQKAT